MTDLRQWLTGLGLERFAEAFEREEVTLASVPALSEADLKELGLPLGPRKQVLKAIEALRGGDEAGPPRSPSAYTPPHLAERILTSRSALEGERKQVSVLFADLKGSLELLADRDPEEARKLLDPVLECMMEAVHHYEGTVNQVMGDGIMALFGAPLAHEDHAVRACYAALRMQEAVNRHSDQLQRTGAMPVQIRVGLNSGEVVVRSIGSDLHMDYTAVGQTTHLASRIEQLARAGSTLLSAETLKLVEGYVQVKSLGRVPVKGLSEPVEVFELTGVGQARSRIQVSAVRGLTRFVGRDMEMETLRRALDQASQGHGQVVAVVGEPGVGKSRLYYEFTHSHRTQGWLILEASSVSYGKATPYLPAIDLLKGYFGIGERDEARAIREKLTGKLLTLDRALESLIAPLGALLGLSVTDAAWASLDPPRRRRETLDALKRLLLREAQAQPLIVVFEDLHWIDSETQAFLDSLVESLPSARLLLLTNFRPEYRSAWSAKSCFTQVRVDALGPDSAKALLASLLGTDVAFQALKRLLIERTEGNPFFLEESVRTLYETGVLEGARGSFRLVKPVDAIQVPPTAQALLAARIDRLDPQNKALLQTASVLGKDVPYLLLKEIAGLTDDELRRRLAELQAAEFVYETSLYPDLEYTFKHALTHEVAYGSLLGERRREMHGRIVNAIEQLYAERLEDQAERLAHHAEHAALWDKALPYLRGAAHKASMRWAFREAAAYLERALAVSARQPDRAFAAEEEIDIRLDLRTALMPAAQLERMAQIVPEAVALAQRIGDRQRLAWAHAYEAYVAIELGRQAPALESGHRALVLAEAIGEPVLTLNAQNLLTQVNYTVGKFDRAIEIGRRAIEAKEEIVVSALQQRTYAVIPYYLVHAHAEVGFFHDAVSAAKVMMRRTEAAGHPFAISVVSVGTGYMHVRRGTPFQAIPLLERAVTLCQTYTIDVQMPWAAACLGLAYAFAGRHEEGIQHTEEGVRFGELLRLTRFQPLRVGFLAHACLLAGRYGDAQQTAASALELARRYHEPGPEAWALYLLAECKGALARTNTAGTRDAYLTAMHLAEELGMCPLAAHCHMGLGRTYAGADDRDKGREHLTTALTMYREMEMQTWPEQAASELAALG